MFQKKTIRYYYWLLIEFVKKHVRMILLSFFLSFFIITSLVAFSPYLDRFLFTKKEVIGLIGAYTPNTLPNDVGDRISHGLVVENEKGEIVPALASSWEMLNGGSEFHFHLKSGLFWDDGKEFTAKDLNYSFKDVQVKIIDKDTVYFILKKKLPIFPTYLTRPIIKYPLHGVAGLYKVDNFKLRQGVVTEIYMSPNKNNLPLVSYRFYDSESKLLNAYKTGAINQMTLYKKSLADTFKGWNNTKVTRTVDYTRVMTLFFNLNKQFVASKEVRQAINLAIPRSKLQEFGEFANSPIPPTSWAYNPDLKQTVEDLDTSTKNLDKYIKDASGSAKLDFETYYDYLPTANVLEDNFQKVHLDATVNLTNFDTPENYDMFLAFWQIPQDPDQYFFWHSTQSQGNLTSYKNVRVDKLLEDGRNTLVVPERKAFYMQFQKTIADDLPAIFLYYPYAYTVERK